MYLMIRLSSKHAKAAALFLMSACLLSGATATHGAVAAQRAPAPDKISARAKGRGGVVIRERGRTHTLDISKHVDAARIEDVSALFMTRRGGFVYLLLKVCGLSKVPPDDRQCGAGVECNVVWLKLDGGWRVRDSKSERYESCWQPITSDEGPKVAGRRLTLVIEDLREEVRREVTYDADSPEGGLTVKQSAIPKSNP
jgi:hypothetical protein